MAKGKRRRQQRNKSDSPSQQDKNQSQSSNNSMFDDSPIDKSSPKKQKQSISASIDTPPTYTTNKPRLAS